MNKLKFVSAFIFVLLLSSHYGFSQKLSGRVSSNGKALEYASVRLTSGNNELAAGTDVLGRFTLSNLKTGVYKLLITHVGYFDKDTVVQVQNDLDIQINLLVDTIRLKEVMVESKKPLVEKKVDRLVFNVEKNINTTGLNTIDLVAKAPLVIVRNEAINIIGKGDVVIYLNDRPLNISGAGLNEYLKNIPVENIVRIEIITNPSARYEASGSGGIINIVTKKVQAQGYWGNANLGLSANRNAVIRPGINLNFNSKKVRYFAGLNMGYGSNPSTYYNRIDYPQETWESNTTDKEYSKVLFLSTGLETNLGKKTEFAFSANGLLSHPDKNIYGNITYKSVATGNIDSVIELPTNEKKAFKNLTGNLHLKKTFDSTGRALTMDLDMLQNAFDYGYTSDKTTFSKEGIMFPNSNSFRKSQKDQDAGIISLNTEYNFTLRNLKVVAGAKLAHINNSDDIAILTKNNGVVNPNESDSNIFKTNENLGALFTEISGTHKKFEYQAGLRYEHAVVNGLDQDRNKLFRKTYNGLFPTLNLLYQYNDKSNLSFGFGRRYSRPSFSALNPYRIYYNYYYYKVGNTGLLPYYATNFELVHTYKGWLISSLMYSIENNSIYYLTIPDVQTNVQTITPVNGVSSRSFVIDENVVLMVNKWWKTSNELALIYNKTFSGLAQTIGLAKGFSGVIKSLNSFKFGKQDRVSGDLSMIYNIGGYNSFSNYKDVIYTDVTIRYILTRDKKIQLNAGVRDIFKSKNSSFTEVVNGISNYSIVNNGTRRFSLNVRYVFGNNKLKKARGYSNVGAEQNRIN